jgi:serine/threonine protein kinase
LLSAEQLETVQTEFAHLTEPRQLANELVRLGYLTRFQADQVVEGYANDLVLGPYRLLEPIGEGGMGLVFRAFHQRLNRLVALKTIHSELLAHQPGAVRRFHREAQAIAQLAPHPNVVVLYDYDDINGIHFLAMEYIEGIDLARLVQQQGPLPIPQACDFIRQAAQGLQHAHEAGLVHRDIKPSNLLVTRPMPRATARRSGEPSPDAPTPIPRGTSTAGVVKILDLGLARLTETLDDRSVSALTQTGAVIGTPDYISPEQAVDASRVDIRADLYSLGCTFYYLLTGRPPFPDGSAVEKMVKHKFDTPRPVEELRPRTPPAVQAVLMRLMAKEPANRFQTPQELVEALKAIQFGTGPTRTDVPETAAGDGSIVIIPAHAPREVAATHMFGPDNLVLAARKTAMLQGHNGYVTALAFSADGKMLASGGLDGVVHLWNLAGERPERYGGIRGQLGEVQALAFSPNEPYVITGSAAMRDGHMWRWDYAETDLSRGRSIVPSEPNGVDALAFSRDGSKLAASADSAVLVWTAGPRGLSRSQVIRVPKVTVKSVAFNPDARRVALACRDTTLRIWEFGWFRPSQRAVFTGHGDALSSVAYVPGGHLVATGSLDRTVRLWDADAEGSAPERAILRGHEQGVRLVQFTPRGDLLISVGEGGQIFLWDVATQAPVREWRFDKSVTYSVALTADGRFLATGTSDGAVHLYDLELMLVDELEPTRAIM